ncbi:MAG: DUF3572 family protein [Bauldia sp.]
MQDSAVRSVARDDAETMAIRVLAFLASRPEELGRFLALAGLGPGNLRAAAADPAFLSGVIAFLLQDEPLLLAFAAEAALPPAAIAAAGRMLGADA